MEDNYGIGDDEVEKKKTPQQRADDLTNAVRNFRIAHAGQGLVRATFGNLPDNFKDLEDQMKHLNRAVEQFNLEGDGINVSGSFKDGYTVSRENPCEQQTGEIQ